jgi:Helix-turn-helix domain
MSWEATSWAVEQKTGSPHAKLILLLLANRADEDGICWPSQINLAAQSEQSDDTIQRHLSNLEHGHKKRERDTGEMTTFRPLIRRARNRRTRGRWPGYVYQLLMPGVPGVSAKELPKKPAEKRAARVPLNGSTEPLSAASTEPLSAVSPSRSLRLHRAAGSGVESSSETSLETSAAEPSRTNATRVVGERPRALQGKQGKTEIVQDRIARRLGGDGWLILQAMSPDQLAQITALERRCHLDDRDIDNIRSEANLARLAAREAAS